MTKVLKLPDKNFKAGFLKTPQQAITRNYLKKIFKYKVSTKEWGYRKETNKNFKN